MIGRESRNLYDSSSQQRFSSVSVPAPVVMKRRGNLYDPLQKRLFRLGLNQPDFLPHFVRFKKLSRVEMPKPTLEFFFLLARFHRALVRFPLEFLCISRLRVIIAALKERTSWKSKSSYLEQGSAWSKPTARASSWCIPNSRS